MKHVKRTVILLAVYTVKNGAHDFSVSPGIVMLLLMQSVVYCTANYLRYVMLAFSVGTFAWLTPQSGIISKRLFKRLFRVQLFRNDKSKPHFRFHCPINS